MTLLNGVSGIQRDKSAVSPQGGVMLISCCMQLIFSPIGLLAVGSNLLKTTNYCGGKKREIEMICVCFQVVKSVRGLLFFLLKCPVRLY